MDIFWHIFDGFFYEVLEFQKDIVFNVFLMVLDWFSYKFLMDFQNFKWQHYSTMFWWIFDDLVCRKTITHFLPFWMYFILLKIFDRFLTKLLLSEFHQKFLNNFCLSKISTRMVIIAKFSLKNRVIFILVPYTSWWIYSFLHGSFNTVYGIWMIV